MKNVLVIGGAGYVGCVLVPKLLKEGHRVTVLDIMYFGDKGLVPHPNLTIIEGDMRNIKLMNETLAGQDHVIHLACISNDPSFELDPNLSKSINFESLEPIVLAAKKAKVERFIYVSTSSVYGVSDAPKVTEDHPLVPLTDYNKYKGLSEPFLLKHQSEDFTTVVIRPATICGYSPRTRLDLTVNILTNHAFNRGKIKVFGGVQKRPNIHIEDVTDLYVKLLDYPKEKIAGEVFNAGCQNLSIREVAERVKSTVEDNWPKKGPIEIETEPTNDLRSYHVCSDKIKEKLGFTPSRSIEDAVKDLCVAFEENKLPNSFDDPWYFNIKVMKEGQVQGEMNAQV